MSEGTPPTCLRCGAFMPPAAPAVRGLDLCTGCLKEAPLDPKMFVVISSPPRTVLKRAAISLAAFAVCAALGTAIAYVTARPILLAVFAESLALVGDFARVLVFGWVAFGIFFGSLLHQLIAFRLVIPLMRMVGHAEGKRRVLERVGLPAIAPEDPRFEIAILVFERPRWLQFRIHIDVGIVADAPGGLVFLGARGTRTALRREAIVGAGVERMKMRPPWHAARLDLREGGSRWLCVTEAPWPSQVRARAEEIAARYATPATSAPPPPP